jgi:hypothetical protein
MRCTRLSHGGNRREFYELPSQRSFSDELPSRRYLLASILSHSPSHASSLPTRLFQLSSSPPLGDRPSLLARGSPPLPCRHSWTPEPGLPHPSLALSPDPRLFHSHTYQADLNPPFHVSRRRPQMAQRTIRLRSLLHPSLHFPPLPPRSTSK